MNYEVCLKDGRCFIVVASEAYADSGCLMFLDENQIVVAVFPIGDLLYVISKKN